MKYKQAVKVFLIVLAVFIGISMMFFRSSDVPKAPGLKIPIEIEASSPDTENVKNRQFIKPTQDTREEVLSLKPISPNLNIEISPGDGDSIFKEYRPFETEQFPLLTLDSAEQYLDFLESLALQGNGAAAYELYRKIGQCSESPRDLDSYHQRRLSILESVNVSASIGNDDQLIYNELMFKLCKNVTDEMIELRTDWHHLAIDNGSNMARQYSAASLLATNISEAGKQYKILWDDGYTHGGYGLSHVYSRTDFDGDDPSKPNPVKAYAYHLAQDMVNSAALNNSNRPDAAMFLTDMQNAQGLASSNLTLQQQQEAEILAKDLLRENKKCCVWIWGK